MLTFCLFNARSLIIKLHELAEFLDADHFDVIAIFEPWLSSDVFENEIRWSGYTCFHADHYQRQGLEW